MARYDYCASICFIEDFEVEIEASIDWSNGEPFVVIDGVYVEGHSLLSHDDKLMSDLGYRIADLAESDDALHARVFEREGVSWIGAGSNDPSGRFAVPA